jgi:hypothetical protein
MTNVVMVIAGERESIPGTPPPLPRQGLGFRS